MAELSRAHITTILRTLGWRVRTTGELTQAVKSFQAAYNLDAALHVDGEVGPYTSRALLRSYTRHKSGLPDASAHFNFSEFACKCGGRYSECKRIWVKRQLIRSLEIYRSHARQSISIVSGCRCPQHNRAVGGVSSSQHMFGGAADIHYLFRDSSIASWNIFAGLGRSVSTHKVRHVDRRDISGHNTTGASCYHPTIWNYAS